MQSWLSFIKNHWGKIIIIAVLFAAFLAGPLFSLLKSKNVPLADKLPTIG